MDTATLRNESAPGREFADLTAQAQAAYQEKRTKECIDLTNRVLMSDPGNVEAHALRQSVLSDIQRDLHDARALLEDSRTMSDGHKYRKAAEIILLKILYLDAAHEEAKELLASARGSSSASGYSNHATRNAQLEETAFTASPQPVVYEQENSGHGISLKIPLVFAGILVLAGGFWFFGPKATGKVVEPLTAAVTQPAPSRPVVKPVETNRAATNTPPPPTAPVSPIPVPTNPSLVPAVAVKRESVPAPVPVPAVPVPTPKPVATKEPGSLAVNSPIATDIYMGDKYMGATPTTLQLPPGRQVLEYRHGDLRSVMTHDIRSGETTTALVTFEIKVQINARPWANVFVEGTNRRALGQTPLSDIRVPIGSLLTFENPGFTPKSHRVKEGDSAIQIVLQ